MSHFLSKFNFKPCYAYIGNSKTENIFDTFSKFVPCFIVREPVTGRSYTELLLLL